MCISAVRVQIDKSLAIGVSAMRLEGFNDDDVILGVLAIREKICKLNC